MAEGGEGVLRELLAVFGFGVDTAELKKGETELNKFFKTVRQMGEALAGVFMVDAIKNFVQSNVEAMTAIERTAAQLGISTDEVQAFQYAARSLGLDADGLTNSMGRLQVAQQAAEKGAKMQSGAFSSLGVSLKDANGKSKEADQLFVDVAEGLSKVTDPSKQAGLAVQLFGRQGRQLLPILKQGEEGIDKLIEEFHELGGGYSKELIESSKKLEHEEAKLGVSWTGLKTVALKVLIPAMTAIVNAVTSVASWLARISKSSNIAQVALVAFGAVAAGFAIAIAVANAPLIIFAALLAAAALIIEDIYTFLTGGESEIGDIIDKIFGKGYQTTVLEGIKSTYYAIRDAVKETWETLKKLPGFGESLVGEGAAVPGQVGGAREAFLPSGKTAPGAFHMDEKDVQQALGGGFFAKLATFASSEGHGADIFNPQAGLMRDLLAQAAQANTSPVVQVTVNPSPGMNEKQLGEHTAKVVGEVIKQRHRSAHATLARKPGS